ncbi:hypothetical protein [Blautia wexlerae]|uniref:hypothetical protein n=1 Tax=Blautia wexlerae TaxID=418240 RepID=UPI0034A1832C
MTNDVATRIAESFIKEHNPGLWNGIGNKPTGFSTLIEVYKIFKEKIYMTIQFEIDADEGGNWAHIVKLYNSENDQMIDGYFGYGIDSVQNLTDTILDICAEYVEE